MFLVTVVAKEARLLSPVARIDYGRRGNVQWIHAGTGGISTEVKTTCSPVLLA